MPSTFPFAINGNTLDGGTLPALKYQGASYSRQAIDGSAAGRNQKGKMIRALITQKDKWHLEFAPMTPAQLKSLLEEIDEETFSFTYPDPITGTNKTKTFYVGDRSGAILKMPATNNSRSILWGNVSFDIIEM